MRELEKIKKERAEQKEKEVCSIDLPFPLTTTLETDETRNKKRQPKNRRSGKLISHEATRCSILKTLA